MNLFNLFKTTTTADTGLTTSSELNANQSNQPLPEVDDDPKILPEIPEKIFIENEKPKPKTTMELSDEKPELNNLQTLYRYLEQNLESKGYEHALMNPDSSLMEEHVQFINNDLNLMISKVKTYYGGYLRTIDFHIETRKRNGMIETVEELMTHKDAILDEIKIVSTIEDEANNGKGVSQNLVLGYKKGFRNGMAAITYGTVFGKKN
jgi:hypothetical protein